jgi:hypothetical protein
MEHFTYDHDSRVWCNSLTCLLNSLLIYTVILQLLFISPMPPWTNPNMVCMATLWIPYTLCVESALIQFHRSLTFARFTGVINLVFHVGCYIAWTLIPEREALIVRIQYEYIIKKL